MDNPDWPTPGPSYLSDEMHGGGNSSNILDENYNVNCSSDINYGSKEIKYRPQVTTLLSLKESFRDESDSSSESVFSVYSSNATSYAETVPTELCQNLTREHKSQTIIKRTFHCPVCNYVSFNEKETNHHIKVEHSKNNSADIFKSQSNAGFAASHVEDEGPYTCDECSYESNRVGKLLSHRKVHTWLKNRIDTPCKDSSPKLEKKKYFLRQHPHSVQRFGDPVIELPSVKRSRDPVTELTSVKRSGDPVTEPPSVKRPKRFCCEHCHFSCEESCTMFRHQFLHVKKSQTFNETKSTVFNCWHNECYFFCDTLEVFKRHQDFHDEKYRVLFDLDQGKPEFGCQVCGFLCAKLEYINLHWEVHSESSQNFEDFEPTNEKSKYNICAFTCANMQTLNRHVDKHLKNSHVTKATEPAKKKFKCNICSFSCAKRQYLVRHRNRHSTHAQYLMEADEPSQMKFHCSVCDAAYEREKDLFSHEECHVALSEEYEQFQKKEQIFKCKKCSHSYTEKLYLHLHQNVHNERFKCLYCGKGFKYRKTLNKHMKFCK